MTGTEERIVSHLGGIFLLFIFLLFKPTNIKKKNKSVLHRIK